MCTMFTVATRAHRRTGKELRDELILAGNKGHLIYIADHDTVCGNNLTLFKERALEMGLTAEDWRDVHDVAYPGSDLEKLAEGEASRDVIPISD